MNWLRNLIALDRQTKDLVSIHRTNCSKRYHGEECVDGTAKLQIALIKGEK